MTLALFSGRLLLALVLAIAGVAKLADRDGSRSAMRGFGLSERLARPVALLVPLCELAVAAALVPGASARAGAFAAGGLLLVFSGAAAAALVRGRRPDCNCFGRLHVEPLGWRLLLRNGLLVLLAGFVASQPAADPGWGTLTITAAAAAVVGQAWLWLALLRRYGRALRRIEELEGGVAAQPPVEVGAEAPPFAVEAWSGGRLSLDALLAEGLPLIWSEVCQAARLEGPRLRAFLFSAGRAHAAVVDASCRG